MSDSQELEKRLRELARSIAHWEQLALEAERASAWDRQIGVDLSPPGQSAGDHKAQLYRQTAEALRREISTGEPYCPCCLKPCTKADHR